MDDTIRSAFREMSLGALYLIAAVVLTLAYPITFGCYLLFRNNQNN